MSRDEVTVIDLANAARLVQDFAQGMDKASFMADPKTQSAVLYQILVMGEAVKRLSDEFRTATPHIP